MLLRRQHLRIRFARHVLIEELAYGLIRQRAHEFVDRQPVAEQLDRGNAANTELRGDLLLFLGVQLAEDELALVLLGEPREDRHQCMAGLAPLGPEIDQHRDLERGLHELLVVLFRNVDDIRRIGHGPSFT